MDFYSNKIIFIALVITVAIPISTGRESWSRPEESGKDTERYLRDLCSKTNISNECWDILKPELYRFKDLDNTTVVGVVVDLAITKSSKIHDQLNQLHSHSTNNELKEKYISCSKNYNDVNRNLVVARKDLGTKNYVNIHVQVDDAQEELMNCKQRFGDGSFDPAHITDRNKELGLYLEIVWAATDGSDSTNDNAGHRDRDIWGRPRESRSDTERYLRDVCSNTDRSDECWNVLRPELNQFTDTNGTTIVGVVVDLAIAKSNEIHDKLNRLHSDSKDNEMKEKYISCSKNYNDMSRNLGVARRDLGTKDYLNNIPVQVKDARDELNNCKHKFENDSPDPAHIGDRNKEIELYLDIVWAAANGSKYDNGDKDIWGGPQESRNDTERYLRDLCSKTNRSDECWKILKPELHRLEDSSDNKTVVIAVLDLATTKSKEIHDKLNQLYSDSQNNELKEKYISCSKNYNDVNRNLVLARRDLDSNDRLNVPVEVRVAREELNKCKRAFEKDSFDPAHITDRNKELELYLDIVWVATDALNANNNRT